MLLSVRPQYAAKLISGEKTAELRRVRPSLRPPFKALVYATAPLACVIGAIQITDVVCGNPELIWQSYGPALGISFDELLAYSGTARTLCCWIVGGSFKCSSPFPLGDEPPPRSFRYLREGHTLVSRGIG